MVALSVDCAVYGCSGVVYLLRTRVMGALGLPMKVSDFRGVHEGKFCCVSGAGLVRRVLVG